MANCRSCGAEIAWVRTEAGKMMPVDIDVVDIQKEKDGEVFIVMKSHWGTCPDAKEWRKGK
jgi:hypothetical protein